MIFDSYLIKPERRVKVESCPVSAPARPTVGTVANIRPIKLSEAGRKKLSHVSFSTTMAANHIGLLKERLDPSGQTVEKTFFKAGEDHLPRYSCMVRFNQHADVSDGDHTNKKSAEQQACQRLLVMLDGQLPVTITEDVQGRAMLGDGLLKNILLLHFYQHGIAPGQLHDLVRDQSTNERLAQVYQELADNAPHTNLSPATGNARHDATLFEADVYRVFTETHSIQATAVQILPMLGL